MAESPFVLDSARIVNARGAQHRYELAGELPDLTLPAVRLTADVPVRADLTAESQGNQVMVSGVVRADWVGECRRCLEPATGAVEATFQEVFEPDPVEGETYRLGDDVVDLRPMLWEVLALTLPAAPLCRDDCPGPAPDTHPVGTSGSEEPTTPAPEDDPWSALDQLDLG